MTTRESTLALVVKAVDKATSPLRAIAAKVNAMTGPLKKWQTELDGFRKAFEPLKPIGEAFGKVGGALKSVGSEAVGLGLKLVGLATGAGVAMYTIIHGAIEAGDELGEIAARVGLGVDAFASLRFAAAQADVTQEQFNTSLDRLTKQLGEMHAGKGGAFLAFLNEISPTFAKQVKGAKSTEEAMALLTDAFAKIDDPQRRAALAAQAFGKTNLQMGAFLHQGSAAIQEQQRRYMELHGSSEALAAGAGDLDNALRESGVAFLGLRDAAAGALFPVLTKLAKLVTDFVVKHRDGLRMWAEKTAASIQKWVDSGGFERLVESLSKIANAISAVVNFLGPMGTAFAGVTVLALPLIASLGNLGIAVVGLAIEAFPLLVGAVAALGPAMLAIAPFVAAAVGLGLAGKAIYDNWGEIKFLFQNLGETIHYTLQGFRDLKNEASLGGLLTTGASLAGVGSIVDLFSSADQLGAFKGINSPAAASKSEAQIKVDFSGVPRGVNVSAPPSSAPVSLDVGYQLGAE